VLAAGLEWHCFAHTSLPAEQVEELDAMPVVPFLPGQIRRGLSPVHRLAAIIDGLEKLPEILQEHYPREPRPDDLLFVGYATDVEMIGVARWLEGIHESKRPRVAFVCHHPAHEWKTDPASMHLHGDFHRWIYAAKRVMGASNRTLFLSPLPALSKELSRVLQVPFSTLANCSQVPDGINLEHVRPTYDVGLVGGSRTEQGVTLYPEILRRLKSMRPEIRILLQCMPGRQLDAFRKIIKKDGTEDMVTLVSDPGTPEDYLKRIASCRLILLSYLPQQYCLRGSGVFMDANYVGRPVVASAQTSMGRMIASGISAGVIFGSMEPVTIAGAVCHALDRIEDLSTRAHALSHEWRHRFTADILLKELLDSFHQH